MRRTVVEVRRVAVVRQNQSAKNEYIQALHNWMNVDDGARHEDKNAEIMRIKDCMHRSTESLDLIGLRLMTFPPLYYLTHLKAVDMSKNNCHKVDKNQFKGR